MVNSLQSLCILGMPGSGKSTVGPLIAARLGWQYVDTDLYIESMMGMSIRSIFELKGEAYFRELEQKVIYQVAQPGTVVICGGGAIELCVDWGMLGPVVILGAQFSTLQARLQYQCMDRPIQDLAVLWNRRMPLFAALGVILWTDGLPPASIAECALMQLQPMYYPRPV